MLYISFTFSLCNFAKTAKAYCYFSMHPEALITYQTMFIWLSERATQVCFPNISPQSSET